MNTIKTIILITIFSCAFFSKKGNCQTYTKDIAPIIYKNCSVCHREGEIGPMALTNYEEVKNFSSTIKYVTSTKYMPPWQPDPNYRHFIGENYLSDNEIQLIADWVDAGSPKGNDEDEPLFPIFPTGSVLGEPDLVLTFKESYTHKGNNEDEYRYFVLPTGLTEEKIVKAIELRAGNTKIVHHALLFEDLSGDAKRNDDRTPKYGFGGFGGFAGDDVESILSQKQYPGYVPGQKPLFFPEGLGQTLGAGADLVVQMHYAPWPTDVTDSTTINIFFADDDEEIERNVDNHIMVPLPGVLVNDIFIIPAGSVKRFHGVWDVPDDISLIGITPHMHLLGQDWLVYLETPQGDSINLISIPEWDFNWQGGYFFDELIVAKKGSKIHAFATYDNTSENPNNPRNPPQFVTWGERTTDEMYYLPISFVPYKEGDEDIKFVTSTSESPEKDNTIDLQLSPNPSKDMVNVEFLVTVGESLSVTLTDLNGRIIRTLRNTHYFPTGTHVISFNSAPLESGMYFVNIKGQLHALSSKFMKL